MSMFEKLKAMFTGEPAGPPDPEAAMISCEDALRLVHEFLDGELEVTSAEEVERHFHMCQQCYPHLKLEQAFRDALRRATAGETAPPELRQKVVALLDKARSDD